LKAVCNVLFYERKLNLWAQRLSSFILIAMTFPLKIHTYSKPENPVNLHHGSTGFSLYPGIAFCGAAAPSACVVLANEQREVRYFQLPNPRGVGIVTDSKEPLRLDD